MFKKLLAALMLASVTLTACGGASDVSQEPSKSVSDTSESANVSEDISQSEDAGTEQSEEESKEQSEVEASAEQSEEEQTSQGQSQASQGDSDKPVIAIPPDKLNIIIGVGEAFDIMSDVVGTDETEGDITDKITVEKGNFNIAIIGEYKIMYSLKDSAGNKAETVTRTITVKRTVLKAPPIWEGEIAGEKLNPKPAPVFGGAWYYKVVSSRDKWVGIETVVTLPEFSITRYKDAYNTSLKVDPWVKNLDNPSVYLGGNAKSESDVGLSLSLVTTGASGISKGSVAYRPFWRYITSEDKDVGGYDAHDGLYAVTANGNNCFGNYHWKFTEHYYLPGDKVRIVVYCPEENKMQLQIEVLEVSTLPESVAMRKKYGWNDPQDFFSPVFASPGQGIGLDAEFKRVCAIDQNGNEGKNAIPTNSEVKNTIWHETYLYRMIDGVMYRVPMNEQRRSATAAPTSDKFTVTHDGVDTNKGGEVVTIHPGYSN